MTLAGSSLPANPLSGVGVGSPVIVQVPAVSAVHAVTLPAPSLPGSAATAVVAAVAKQELRQQQQQSQQVSLIHFFHVEVSSVLFHFFAVPFSKAVGVSLGQTIKATIENLLLRSTSLGRGDLLLAISQQELVSWLLPTDQDVLADMFCCIQHLAC